MKNLNYLFIAALLILQSCAMSMSPAKMTTQLPDFTKARFVSQAEAIEAVKSGKGKYLVQGRSYLAPIGVSLKDDLKLGAKGIDEWVLLDGGNAYVMTNYKWITVDGGSTQLYIDFDTMLYE